MDAARGPVKVSVITPTHDRARYLPLAVESVLAQDLPGVEHIVVDDGSRDDTPAAAARFGDRIRFVRQENAGPSAARNRGLSLARGDYIAFLDSDDQWRPGRLSRQVPLLDANPAAGLLYAAVDYIDGDGNPSPVRRSRRGTPSGRILPHLLRHNVMETSTVIVRRRLVEESGGFDPRYRWCEDLDLWLRIAVRHDVIYDPVPSVLMRRHSDQLLAETDRLSEGEFLVLEGNVRRLEEQAPEWAPLARRRLADRHLRRARRLFAEGRPGDAEIHVARAVALAPSRRLPAVWLRLRSRLGRNPPA